MIHSPAAKNAGMTRLVKFPHPPDVTLPPNPHISIMEPFDFNAPAEIYAGMSRGRGRQAMKYRRFDTGAEAIRYAMEELGPEVRGGTVLEAGDDRFTGAEIGTLYDSAEYPLPRSQTVTAKAP